MADETDRETGQDDATPIVTGRGPDQRDLASESEDAFVTSTLFTAQNVRDYLDTQEGLATAAQWCHENGLRRVFIESFRDDYRAERETLERAREYFRDEGFAVAGCVTPTQVGRSSTGWDPIACFTAEESREHLADIFAYTAEIFDVIMVDDFLFTDCECEACVAARGDRSWGTYREDLMVEVSREHLLAPAREANPDVEVIIKYPKWYDSFQERGYVVDRQTADFDTVWVGTEIRDYDDPEWGGTPQYGAYFIMRWLGDVAGAKTEGGWFDTIGTTEDTYLDQAAATVLGGADELLLFCFGLNQEEPGPANVERFSEEYPALVDLARELDGRQPWGIAAPKPPQSAPFDEPELFSFLGMNGVPLVPTAEFEPDAPAIVATPYLLSEPDASGRVREALESGSQVTITEGLTGRLVDDGIPDHENAHVLETDGDLETLLDMADDERQALRNHLLEPFDVEFEAPGRVALHLFGEDDPRVVVQNFTDEPITATLSVDWNVKEQLTVPAAASTSITDADGETEIKLAGRSLVVL